MARAAEVDISNDEFELDKQSLELLFSRFSTKIMDEFLFGNNTNYIDRRIFDMCDSWTYIFNIKGDFVIYNKETNEIINSFYQPFSKLAHKCAMNYDMVPTNRRLAHIRGLVADQFQNKEEELAFDDIVKMTIDIQRK